MSVHPTKRFKCEMATNKVFPKTNFGQDSASVKLEMSQFGVSIYSYLDPNGFIWFRVERTKGYLGSVAVPMTIVRFKVNEDGEILEEHHT